MRISWDGDWGKRTRLRGMELWCPFPHLPNSGSTLVGSMFIELRTLTKHLRNYYYFHIVYLMLNPPINQELSVSH
jgi:hypothetical protein